MRRDRFTCRVYSWSVKKNIVNKTKNHMSTDWQRFEKAVYRAVEKDKAIEHDLIKELKRYIGEREARELLLNNDMSRTEFEDTIKTMWQNKKLRNKKLLFPELRHVNLNLVGSRKPNYGELYEKYALYRDRERKRYIGEHGARELL